MNYETASDEQLMIYFSRKYYKCEDWKLSACGERLYQIEIEGRNHITHINPVLKMTWADMGPVIIDLDISLIRDVSTNNVWLAIPKGWFGLDGFKSSLGDDLSCVHPIPLRAAVIVAIQVLEERKNNEEDQSK